MESNVDLLEESNVDLSESNKLLNRIFCLDVKINSLTEDINDLKGKLNYNQKLIEQKNSLDLLEKNIIDFKRNVPDEIKKTCDEYLDSISDSLKQLLKEQTNRLDLLKKFQIDFPKVVPDEIKKTCDEYLTPINDSLKQFCDRLPDTIRIIKSPDYSGLIEKALEPSKDCVIKESKCLSEIDVNKLISENGDLKSKIDELKKKLLENKAHR